MRTCNHLRIVAWTSLVFAVLYFVPGLLFAAEQWKNMQRFSGVGEGLSLMFFIGAVFVVTISLFYFRIASAYFQTAAGKLLFPDRGAVIFVMILGFPYGTALGAYALYARKQHMLNQEDAEQD